MCLPPFESLAPEEGRISPAPFHVCIISSLLPPCPSLLPKPAAVRAPWRRTISVKIAALSAGTGRAASGRVIPRAYALLTAASVSWW